MRPCGRRGLRDARALLVDHLAHAPLARAKAGFWHGWEHGQSRRSAGGSWSNTTMSFRFNEFSALRRITIPKKKRQRTDVTPSERPSRTRLNLEGNSQAAQAPGLYRVSGSTSPPPSTNCPISGSVCTTKPGKLLRINGKRICDLGLPFLFRTSEIWVQFAQICFAPWLQYLVLWIRGGSFRAARPRRDIEGHFVG